MEFINSFLYVFFIGVLSNFTSAAADRSKFRYDKFPYRAFGWERDGKIYEKIGIRTLWDLLQHYRRWKEKLPDISRHSPLIMRKQVTVHMRSVEIRRLIAETCAAERTHVRLSLASGIIIFFWKNKVGVYLWVLCILGNLPFILIQRYNRPQLIRLLERTKRREARLAIRCDGTEEREELPNKTISEAV